MSLYDLLKPQLTGKPPAPAVQLGNTQALQKLVQAKTGKATTDSSSPQQSALGEAVAAGQASLQQQQTNQAGFITKEAQAQQALDQQEQQRIQLQELEMQKREGKQKFTQQMNNVLNEYTQGQKQLNTAQDLANLEQVGFGIRLGSDEYINKLQTVGDKNRLENKANFELQIAKDTFGESQTLKLNDLAFKNMMAMDDREFDRMLASISIEDAINEMRFNQKQANAEMLGQGMSTGIKSGISMWDKYTSQPEEDTDIEIDEEGEE